MTGRDYMVEFFKIIYGKYYSKGTLLLFFKLHFHLINEES